MARPVSDHLSCKPPAFIHCASDIEDPAHMQLTCTPDAPPMQLTCTSHAAHMQLMHYTHTPHVQLTCTPHAHHMHLPCSSHAHHMHTTCTPHVSHTHTSRAAHMQLSCITTTPLVHPIRLTLVLLFTACLYCSMLLPFTHVSSTPIFCR